MASDKLLSQKDSYQTCVHPITLEELDIVFKFLKIAALNRRGRGPVGIDDKYIRNVLRISDPQAVIDAVRAAGVELHRNPDGSYRLAEPFSWLRVAT